MSNAQPGFVYLCRNKRNGYVKIGYSTNPAYRESTLQSEEPDVFFEHVAPGSLQDEQGLHRVFAEKRVRGEWFELSPKDIARAKWILNGCPEDEEEERARREYVAKIRIDSLRYDATQEFMGLLNRLDFDRLRKLLEQIRVLNQIKSTDVVFVPVEVAWQWYLDTPDDQVTQKGPLDLPPFF